MDDAWKSHLIESPEAVGALLARTKTVAVLGIKDGSDPGQPAWYVPAFAKAHGLTVIPVPVFYPDATEILGERVYRRVSDIPQRVDLVNVFRRAADIPPHVDDIIAARPAAVWLQLGIRNEAAAERLARAGIDVVQDLCLKVEMEDREM
jgi:predicted CoA-binding protein